MTFGGQHATRYHGWRSRERRPAPLGLAPAEQRIDVVEPLAVERDAAQKAVVQRPLDQVGEAGLARRQQHPPVPHDAGDGRARLAVRAFVRQLVRPAERLAVVARADAAGEVQLVVDEVLPLAVQRLEQRLRRRSRGTRRRRRRPGTARGRRGPRPRSPRAPARGPGSTAAPPIGLGPSSPRPRWSTKNLARSR